MRSIDVPDISYDDDDVPDDHMMIGEKGPISSQTLSAMLFKHFASAEKQNLNVVMSLLNPTFPKATSQ